MSPRGCCPVFGSIFVLGTGFPRSLGEFLAMTCISMLVRGTAFLRSNDCVLVPEPLFIVRGTAFRRSGTAFRCSGGCFSQFRFGNLFFFIAPGTAFYSSGANPRHSGTVFHRSGGCFRRSGLIFAIPQTAVFIVPGPRASRQPVPAGTVWVRSRFLEEPGHSGRVLQEHLREGAMSPHMCKVPPFHGR